MTRDAEIGGMWHSQKPRYASSHHELEERKNIISHRASGGSMALSTL